jgi:hypothetical protein
LNDAVELQNRIYRGEDTHTRNAYPGEHKANEDRAPWDKVQAVLTENRVDRASTEKFIQEENLKIFKKRLETASDEARRRMLLRLLAEEAAKGARLANRAQPKAETVVPTWDRVVPRTQAASE